MIALGVFLLLGAADGLSVDQAIALAVKQSPTLRARAAEQREVIAEGAVDTQLENPQLRVGNFRSDRLITPAVKGQPYSDTPLGGLNVGLRWKPPNPMVGSARNDEAKRRAEAVGAQAEGEKRALVAKVRTLYVTATNLDRQLQLAKQSVDLRIQLAALNRQRIAAQAARGVDSSLADLDELEARAQLLELEQKRRASLRELTAVLGLAPGAPLVLTTPDRACEAPKEDVAALAALATTNDPKLEERKAKLLAVAAERSRARLELIPWFDFVQLGYVLQNESTPGYAAFRLGVTLPLLGFNGNRVELLDATRDRIDAEFEGDKDTLMRNLEEALADVRDDAELVTRYREAAPRVVDERLSQLQKSVEAGATSQLDFAAVQARSLSAQRAGLNAELHCQLSLIQLDAVVGR